MKLKIALDVDGVLADVIESLLIYSNKIRCSISKEEITNWVSFLDQRDFSYEIPDVSECKSYHFLTIKRL